jgi:hypothetical protein
MNRYEAIMAAIGGQARQSAEDPGQLKMLTELITPRAADVDVV